mgnify:CR=1 FL=1
MLTSSFFKYGANESTQHLKTVTRSIFKADNIDHSLMFAFCKDLFSTSSFMNEIFPQILE